MIQYYWSGLAIWFMGVSVIGQTWIEMFNVLTNAPPRA